MKTNVISILAAAISVFTFSEVQAQLLLEEMKIIPPVFPDREVVVEGETCASIDQYLINGVEYTLLPGRNHLAGTEVIRFEVSVRGELTSFQVINSISPEIDAEVIRVLRTTSGKWIPGNIDGKPFTMTREISLVFKPFSAYDLVGNARVLQGKGNKLMFLKNNSKRALRYYDRAVKLLPYEECILAARCLCKYELGDEKGYQEDLERMMALNPDSYTDAGSLTLERLIAQLRTDALEIPLSE